MDGPVREALMYAGLTVVPRLLAGGPVPLELAFVSVRAAIPGPALPIAGVVPCQR